MPVDLMDLVKLAVTAGVIWWLIGGWASFRQPRVFVPLLLVVPCLAIGAWASAGIDAIRAGEDRPLSAEGLGQLALVAMLLAVGCLGWAVVAGFQLRRARAAAPDAGP